MSERTEGDAAASHGCAGEPPRVGGRRRRLTLAPRPWVAALAGEEKAEVRPVVFADSDGELSSARRASLVCSSVGSSSTLLSSLGHGCRFWALADDVSSEDDSSSSREASSDSEVDGCPGGSASARSASPLLPRAQIQPAAVDERAGAPSALEGLRPIAAGRASKLLVSHPKLVRQQGKAGKPWKGPLPAARVARAWSLGDL
jgi:hypothetical protein